MNFVIYIPYKLYPEMQRKITEDHSFHRINNPEIPSNIQNDISLLAETYSNLISEKIKNNIPYDIVKKYDFTIIKILYHPSEQWKKLYKGNSYDFSDKSENKIKIKLCNYYNFEHENVHIDKYDRADGNINGLNKTNITEKDIFDALLN